MPVCGAAQTHWPTALPCQTGLKQITRSHDGLGKDRKPPRAAKRIQIGSAVRNGAARNDKSGAKLRVSRACFPLDFLHHARKLRTLARAKKG
jgi:hypothetical protein